MTSITDRLLSVASTPPAPAVTGHWFNIRLCPDLALGELLNVGVGYVDSASEKIYTRLVDRFDRFRSLYGEGFEDEMRTMLRILESTLGTKAKQPPIPNLRFSELKFAAGNSVEDILDRLYQATVVTSSPSAPGETQSRESSAGNEAVRKFVFDELKRIAGLSADRIISSQPMYTVTENGRAYALDIPLRGARHLGSVVSARYKTIQPVEANLLRATVDLETASRVFKQDQLGLFVVRPAPDPIAYPQERLTQIDNIIDQIGWKLHKQGVYVGVDDAPAALAEEIAEWADVRA